MNKTRKGVTIMDAITNLKEFMKQSQYRYDVSANNLANSTTGGFKKALVLEREGFNRTYVDPTPGPLQETTNPLDFAINGNGYFVVRGPQGTTYTRNGNFHLNLRRELVTQSGKQVLDDLGRPIVIDGRPTISEDGAVYSGDLMVTRLAIVKPLNQEEVISLEGSEVNFNPDWVERGEISIQTGYLEDSNVNPLQQMTDNIEIMRSFEFAQRILKLNQTISERSATEIGNTQK
jgi:flagellar basal-body rod protein FlgF